MLVAQSCPTLCNPMDCSPPGSSVHGILQARTLEWVAICFSKGSSRPRDWTQVSRIAGKLFTIWATRPRSIPKTVISNVSLAVLTQGHTAIEWRSQDWNWGESHTALTLFLHSYSVTPRVGWLAWGSQWAHWSSFHISCQKDLSNCMKLCCTLASNPSAAPPELVLVEWLTVWWMDSSALLCVMFLLPPPRAALGKGVPGCGKVEYDHFCVTCWPGLTDSEVNQWPSLTQSTEWKGNIQNGRKHLQTTCLIQD